MRVGEKERAILRMCSAVISVPPLGYNVTIKSEFMNPVVSTVCDVDKAIVSYRNSAFAVKEFEIPGLFQGRPHTFELERILRYHWGSLKQ